MGRAASSKAARLCCARSSGLLGRAQRSACFGAPKMRRGEQKKSDQKRLFPSLPTPHAMLVTQWRRRVYIHRAGHKRGDASTKSCFFFFLPRHQVTYIYKSYQQLHLDASCHSSVASIPNDERNRLAYAETFLPRRCRKGLSLFARDVPAFVVAVEGPRVLAQR